jgi:hypothetical protein
VGCGRRDGGGRWRGTAVVPHETVPQRRPLPAPPLRRAARHPRATRRRAHLDETRGRHPLVPGAARVRVRVRVRGSLTLHYDVLHITPVLPAAALTWMKRVGATLSFQVRPGLGLGSGLGRSLAARMRTMPQGAQLAARETLAALVHSGALSVRSPTSRVVSPRGRALCCLSPAARWSGLSPGARHEAGATTVRHAPTAGADGLHRRPQHRPPACLHTRAAATTQPAPAVTVAGVRRVSSRCSAVAERAGPVAAGC